jgi:MarR family transcriptional repressor of emrRAB
VTISDVTREQFFGRFETGVARVQALHPAMPRDPVVRVRLLYHTLRLLSDRLDAFFAEQGVSTVGWGVLMMTYALPEQVNPSSLSEALGQSRTHMTRATDELVAKGWLQRTVAEDDRRRIDLRITAEGRKFIARVLPQAWAEYARCLDVFSETEARTLERLLRKLLGHLTSLDQQDAERAAERRATSRKGRQP